MKDTDRRSGILGRKNEIGQLIWALRPVQGVLVILLALASFRLTVAPLGGYAFIVGTALFLGACSVMLWNDYVDRFHDRRKGKFFAVEHPGLIWVTAICFWGLTIIGGLVIGYLNWPGGVLLGILAIIGYMYGHSVVRKTPYLSMILVTISIGLVPWVAATAGTVISFRLGLFSLAAAAAIAGREILKDIIDLPIDDGYKSTLPLLLGKWASLRIAGGLFILGGSLALAVVPTPVGLVGSCLIMAGGVALLSGRNPSRYFFDLGFLVFLLTVISGLGSS